MAILTLNFVSCIGHSIGIFTLNLRQLIYANLPKLVPCASVTICNKTSYFIEEFYWWQNLYMHRGTGFFFAVIISGSSGNAKNN